MKAKRICWMVAVGLLAVPGWATAYTASNGVVTDQRTGLVWQQQDDGQLRTWEGAIAYCEGLSMSSLSDWRLPNLKELESITDVTRVNPAIDPIFTGVLTFYDWSSTTYKGNSSRAWVVGFSGGHVSHFNKLNEYYVRCVRGGQ